MYTFIEMTIESMPRSQTVINKPSTVTGVNTALDKPEHTAGGRQHVWHQTTRHIW